MADEKKDVDEKVWNTVVRKKSTGPADTGWIENPEGAIDEEGNRRREAGVAEALNALGKRPSLMPGRSNRLGYFFMGKMLSRARAIRLVSGSVEKMFGPFKEVV